MPSPGAQPGDFDRRRPAAWRRLGGWAVVFVSTLALVGCGAGAPLPSSPEPASTSPGGPLPTSLFPSRTPTPSSTPTASATASPTPFPTPDFHDASIYAVAHLPRSRLLVTISVPRARTDPQVLGHACTAGVGPSQLDCEVLAQYPDRLYCTGPEPFISYRAESADLALYDQQSPGPVFVTTFTIPGLPTLTPTPSATASPTPTP